MDEESLTPLVVIQRAALRHPFASWLRENRADPQLIWEAQNKHDATYMTIGRIFG
jgi:hypothetical protein